MHCFCNVPMMISDLPDILELTKKSPGVSGTFTTDRKFTLVAHNTSHSPILLKIFREGEKTGLERIIKPNEVALDPDFKLKAGTYTLFLFCTAGTGCSGWVYPIFL